MSKSNYSEEEEEETLEELLHSVLDEDPGSCIKCGNKMIQKYQTKWSTLSTEIKLKCEVCGHSSKVEKKLLS